MTIPNLIAELKANHLQFTDYINGLTKAEFEFSKDNEKWTAGQEIDHIIKSTSPIAQVLKNKPYLIEKFGELDRASMSYDEVIEMYQKQINSGAKAMGRFIPESIEYQRQQELSSQLTAIVDSICLSTRGDYSEEELKKWCIPHPLLGKLSVLEMLYFTNHHVQHHFKNSLRNLGKSNG